MGKGSKAPSSQTVTNTPYLKNDVQYAANQARNLYQGYTPEMSQKSSQIQSLNDQIAAAQKASQVTQSTYTDGIKGKLAAYQRSSQPNPNLQALISQRDAAQAELSGMAPNQPKYYQDQTYVDYSPETLAALDSITQRATDGSPLNQAAGDTTLATIRGDYLNSNPYIDDVVNNSLNDVNKKYAEQILPGLASGFASSGRYGSGIQQQLTSNAVGQLGREAMGVATGIRADNYNQERNRQLQATALAPSLAQSDYYDAQQLMGVGSAREALSQAELQDKMDRYYYEQNAPQIALDQYISRIGSLNSGGGTQTTSGGSARSANPLLTGMGLASQGLGLYGAAQGLGLLGGTSLLGAGAAAGGSTAGLYAGLAALSDERVKENIKYLGQENGHKVYEFTYKAIPNRKFRGVMAQEVAKTHPEAIRDIEGYMAVDYSKIGVNFVEVQ